MKHFKIFVIIALCVSLFVNFNLLSRLDNLENRVNSIASYQQQVINTVHSQTNNVRNIIDDMKKEQSWLSPISVRTETTDIDKGEAVVNFQWQVKELKDNSQVVFNYKHGDEQEYTSIPAVEKGSGLFEATVPIEVTLEPEWRVDIRDRSKGADARRERAIEEKSEEYKRDNQLSLNYFVTVTHNDMVKSSDIAGTRIDNLGVRQYGLLETHTDISRDNHYSVSVLGFSFYDASSSFLKEVYLKKYNNGKRVDQEKLISSDINEAGMPIREKALTFHTGPSSEKLDYTSLIIKAIYSDGATFEEEIYHK